MEKKPNLFSGFIKWLVSGILWDFATKQWGILVGAGVTGIVSYVSDFLGIVDDWGWLMAFFAYVFMAIGILFVFGTFIDWIILKFIERKTHNGIEVKLEYPQIDKNIYTGIKSNKNKLVLIINSPGKTHYHDCAIVVEKLYRFRNKSWYIERITPDDAKIASHFELSPQKKQATILFAKKNHGHRTFWICRSKNSHMAVLRDEGKYNAIIKFTANTENKDRVSHDITPDFYSLVFELKVIDLIPISISKTERE